MRFITATGYRGAVEINMLTLQCRAIWTHRYVYDIVTHDDLRRCVVYDDIAVKYYTDDAERDITDQVVEAIVFATKHEGINATIAYPGHIATQDRTGQLVLVNLVQ